MQVLSQLSYNPTVGPLIGADIGRHPGPVSRLLGGRVPRTPAAGLHHPGSLDAGCSAYCSRVIAFVAEYSSRVPDSGSYGLGRSMVASPSSSDRGA